MRLSPDQQAILDRLVASRGLEFSELVRVAGLDPARDFRGADLRDVDFGTADLRGYDLREADLRGSDLSRARLDPARVEGAAVRGAKLPAAWLLSPVQLEAISAITRHIQEGGRRALVSMPLGTGISALIQHLAESFKDADKRALGLVLFSSRASADQFRSRLATQHPGFAMPLSQLQVGAPAAVWYVATYRELDQLRGDARKAVAGVVAHGLTHLILAEADHPSWKLIAPILGDAAGAVQVAFVTRHSESQTRRVEDHFGADLVFALSPAEAREYGLLRPYRVLDRSAAAAGPPGAEIGSKQAPAIADDLFKVLSDVGRVRGKTLVLSTTLEQSLEMMATLNAIYPYNNGPEAETFAERPKTQRDLRAALDRRGRPPFVVCCSPASAGEAFETPPDVIALLLNDISGRTRQLWESARRARGAENELLVLDYTGKVAQEPIDAPSTADDVARLDAAIQRERRRRDRAGLPSEAAAAEVRLATLRRRRSLMSED